MLNIQPCPDNRQRTCTITAIVEVDDDIDLDRLIVELAALRPLSIGHLLDIGLVIEAAAIGAVTR